MKNYISPIDSIKNGVGKSAAFVNNLKLNAKRVEFWEQIGLSPQRTEDLFNDDYMELFCSHEVKKTINDGPQISQLMLPIRHKKMLDDFSTYKNIKQVVILGAGFDTKPHQLRTDNEIKIFEVDQAEILEIKEKIYNNHNIDIFSKYIPIDYIKDDLIKNLFLGGINFELPTHFIWEGNSQYIPLEIISELWKKIFTNFNSFVSLSFDYFTKDFINEKTGIQEHRQALNILRNMGAFPITGFNNMKDFAAQNNLRIISDVSCADLALKYKIHSERISILEYCRITHLVKD